MSFYKLRFILLLAIWLKVLVVSAQTTGKSQKVIICLTYDDGLESHLSTAIPQLNTNGLKATFFLNSIPGSAPVIGQASPALLGWKRAAENGHELANHTLFHPCPEKFGWPQEVAIERYSIERILQEVRTMDALLSSIDNKVGARSFAFPCNNVLVQGKDYVKEVQKQGLVKYARIGGDQNSIIKDLKTIDALHVPSWLVEEGTTLKELIEFAEKARTSGGMAVYQFHGIGGQFFKISKETHSKFLQYLKENQQNYWVTTFSEAMQSITIR